MTLEQQIAEGLRTIIGAPPLVWVAKVVEVDETQQCCNVERPDGMLIYDVRLRAALDNGIDGLLIIPTVGSQVVITPIGKSKIYYISMFSSIKEVIYQNGQNGGLIKIEELKSQLNKVSKRIDDIISALNQASPDSSTGTFKASLTPLLSSIQDKENFADIENENFKH